MCRWLGTQINSRSKVIAGVVGRGVVNVEKIGKAIPWSDMVNGYKRESVMVQYWIEIASELRADEDRVDKPREEESV